MLAALRLSLLLALLLLERAVALVPVGLDRRADPADAPFTVSLSAVNDAIVCPRGIKSRPGGVVLLVHGTAISGVDAWEKGPYNTILPDLDPGFDVCWIELPDKSTGDVQVASEYVAASIKPLAAKSATGKVSLIGHSQGTVNVQWALTFWPSLRVLVEDFISLSGDFKGSTLLPICPLVTCNKALWQQQATSRFIKALNVGGSRALVDTTNIVTRYDEIVMPQNGPVVSGWLDGGSTRFALQDANVCGLAYVVTHSSLLIDPASFGLAYTALTTPGPAPAANPSDCKLYRNTPPSTSISAFAAAFGPTLAGMATSLLTNVVSPKVTAEPKLKPYVCAAGSAPASDCESA